MEDRRSSFASSLAPLIEKLSLNLATGGRLGIVGHKGLGKSTLLKIMLGEIVPTRTEINYVGSKPSPARRRSRKFIDSLAWPES